MTRASSLRESSEESPKGTSPAQSRRFTPLRCQAIPHKAREEQTLSRLIPAARLRSYA